MDTRRLRKRLDKYEQRFGMDSADFYQRFENGELGDDMAFVEWSALYSMYQDAEEELQKGGWRPAVENVMYHATLAEAFARFGPAMPAFNYRWEHVTAVVTLALKLAELTGADPDVVEAAAWLHDAAKTEKDHADAAAQLARDFLPRTDFPPEKIERVAQAITGHEGLWRDEPLTSLESAILWDADKLAKMGLTAAFHWAGWKAAGGKQTTVGEWIANGRRVAAEWQHKTVASMHTAPARRAAQRRLAAFTRLWDELEAELNGDDLLEG